MLLTRLINNPKFGPIMGEIPVFTLFSKNVPGTFR
jgi:hypothetical protein